MKRFCWVLLISAVSCVRVSVRPTSRPDSPSGPDSTSEAALSPVPEKVAEKIEKVAPIIDARIDDEPVEEDNSDHKAHLQAVEDKIDEFKYYILDFVKDLHLERKSVKGRAPKRPKPATVDDLPPINARVDDDDDEIEAEVDPPKPKANAKVKKPVQARIKGPHKAPVTLKPNITTETTSTLSVTVKRKPVASRINVKGLEVEKPIARSARRAESSHAREHDNYRHFNVEKRHVRTHAHKTHENRDKRGIVKILSGKNHEKSRVNNVKKRHANHVANAESKIVKRHAIGEARHGMRAVPNHNNY